MLFFPASPFSPALRSGQRLFQRPSPQKQFLSSNTPLFSASSLCQGYDRHAGPATGFFTGLHAKSKSLAIIQRPSIHMNLGTAVVALTWMAVNLSAIAGADEIPTSTNAWEAAKLQVLDKNIALVYAKANDLYFRSIQQDFPQIQTLADLIGKDDYYFYPEEQADKFRADDAAVIASGTFFETIEENQPIGGVLNYVYVSKSPQFDSTNEISGLRIAFYNIPKPGQTVIPAATNEWERTQLFVIDKNTESVFLNANEGYISSVQGNFPDIKSVMNLIGRDDFYFYSPEDAIKFQADDKQVMTTGVGYTAIEANQQQGGEVIYTYVTKSPLVNDAGETFGIRVTFFELPNLSISSESGGRVDLTWPEVHSVYDLEESSDLSSDWTRVATEPVLVDGFFKVTVTTAGSRFFRLRMK